MLHNCIDTVDLLECNSSNTIVTQDIDLVKYYSRNFEYSVDNRKSIQTMPLITSSKGLKKSSKSLKTLKKIQEWGYGNLPVCMAKTQYSFSHDAGMLGAPSGFELPVREFRLNAGAGFVVAILGSIMTMPGLPKRPAANDMDMDEDGNLVGVFG